MNEQIYNTYYIEQLFSNTDCLVVASYGPRMKPYGPNLDPEMGPWWAQDGPNMGPIVNPAMVPLWEHTGALMGPNMGSIWAHGWAEGLAHIGPILG